MTKILHPALNNLCPLVYLAHSFCSGGVKIGLRVLELHVYETQLKVIMQYPRAREFARRSGSTCSHRQADSLAMAGIGLAACVSPLIHNY